MIPVLNHLCMVDNMKNLEYCFNGIERLIRYSKKNVLKQNMIILKTKNYFFTFSFFWVGNFGILLHMRMLFRLETTNITFGEKNNFQSIHKNINVVLKYEISVQ